jgi:hypothetical protein
MSGVAQIIIEINSNYIKSSVFVFISVLYLIMFDFVIQNFRIFSMRFRTERAVNIIEVYSFIVLPVG